jgi:hypothetical protein
MTAPGPPQQPRDGWTGEVGRLWKAIREIGRQTLYSVTISKGGLTLQDDATLRMLTSAGVSLVYVGKIGADQVMQLRRADDSVIMATQRDVTSGRLYWSFWDYAAHQVLADDVQSGGLAIPWIPIPLYPLFSMAAASVYAYMNLPTTSIASETTLWEGRIDRVAGPRIQVNGLWGAASGTNTTRYKLKVDGTQVGTWDSSTLEVAVKGPGSAGVTGTMSLATLIGTTNVSVQLTAQTLSGSGSTACQVLGCTQRQT